MLQAHSMIEEFTVKYAVKQFLKNNLKFQVHIYYQVGNK
jgi:hypothetical protein